MSKLVVETRELEVGIREPKTLVIYPLSFGAQKRFADKIAKMLEDFSEKAGEGEISTVDTVKIILELIEENIQEIAKMVCEQELDLEDVTNDQIMDLCTAIFEMNYEGGITKVKELSKKVKSLWK